MTARQKLNGFTMIEVLVVVMIIGICTAILVPQLGNLGSDQTLKTEARRMTVLMELASDEAVIQGREYGIRFGQGNLIFYELDLDTGAWEEVQGDDSLRERRLPEAASYRLWVEDREIELDRDAREFPEEDNEKTLDADGNEIKIGPPPHIAILSSGEMTPFELLIERDFDPTQFIVSGDSFGAIAIKEETF
ncbi:MAG: type II secretion system minor pseudopilin GspH [Pseudomonadota bacterium]